MKAFEDLYHEHVKAVFRFAMSVAGRRDTAEDLTSEAFLALYRNLDAIDETRLPGWLLTVVRNRARDLWRHQEVEQRHAEALVSPDVAPTGLPLEQWILEGRPETATPNARVRTRVDRMRGRERWGMSCSPLQRIRGEPWKRKNRYGRYGWYAGSEERSNAGQHQSDGGRVFRPGDLKKWASASGYLGPGVPRVPGVPGVPGSPLLTPRRAYCYNL